MKNILAKENFKTKIKVIIVLFVLLPLFISYFFSNYKKYVGITERNNVEAIQYKTLNKILSGEKNSQLYLSDIDPCNKSIGYGDLKKDMDINGNPITLKVENNWFTFEKGIFAHATATLIYDLTDYKDNYKYFVAFVGLNSSAAAASNGVIYHFYTSDDKKNWQEVGESIKKMPGENSTYVEITLNEAKYLKIYIDDNSGNGSDHSALGEAKLVNSLDNNFVLDSVEDYNNEIKKKFPNQTEITSELEFLLLKRELVKNVGQYTINSFYNTSQENKDTINWLMNNQDVLRYYILGGTPEGGSYYNSLTQLSRLYHKYKDDFSIKDKTIYGTEYGDLYTRMAIALSLTHSQSVGLWLQSVGENKSDALTRYDIYKYMHKNGNFVVLKNEDGSPKFDVSKWFENYSVEEMRWIFNNLSDDEEILWFNEYTQSFIDKDPNSYGRYLSPHPYMDYRNENLNQPEFYDENRKDAWDKTFNGIFSKYGVTYKPGLKKIWMLIRNDQGILTGAVCGGISKIGSTVRTVHGIPSVVIGQPGHAAILYYWEDDNGNGYWNLDNDVSGWTLSEKGERMLLGWGNANTDYARGSHQVVYVTLAQEALNDYDNLVKAEEIIMLADTYSDNLKKQESLYRNAVSVQSINFDAWYKLVKLYLADSSKTEADYYRLAEEITDNLKYYPLPMYQLTNLLKPKFTSVEYSYRFTLLQTRALTEASQTPNNTEDKYYVYQPSITRTEANFLLGKIDTSIASFSFDGNDAGKIVLSSRFDGNGIRWDYSLDGKKTWKEVSFSGDEIHKLQLTKSQINSITEENDIYVHIVGVDYSDNNLYKIDITKETLLNNFYANDLENRIIGVNLNTEWRYNEQSKWTSYKDGSPDLTGDKTIQIRQSATGTRLASDPSPFYTFTQDVQPDKRKYIPVSHLSIHSVSTEAVNNGGAAANAIDGNYNTRWHSAWNGTDTERYIVIKLDYSVSLSAVEFVPCGGGNGKIYDGTIYGSIDGKNWEELTSAKNLTYTNSADTIDQAIANIKSFEIDKPREVQYVKIVANRTNGNWITARAFNLYQDITKNPHPTAGIDYSTTDKTNGKVVARLVNPSTKITITNNNGSDTYIFTENGEFTFEFVNEKGQTGRATAKVNWIDKDIPTADIDYNVDNNKKIVISLDNINEDVYLLDKNNNKINFIEVDHGKVTTIIYLDLNGNVYKTVDVDENGCITKITYKNTSGKVSQVETYVTIVNNGTISSEEYYDVEGNVVNVTSEEKEILKGIQQSMANPLEYTFEESGDYEFKLIDKASNVAYKSIKVDYVDNDVIVSDVTYDKTSLTNQNVIATINAYVINDLGEKLEAELTSGNKQYTFTENGSFTFKYKSSKDTINYNIKEHIAEVTWIDKKTPTAHVKYETKANGKVVATLINESETIIITNNNASREYVFTKNGEFTFEFEDIVGNKGSAKAVVNSIKKDEEITTPENNTNRPVESNRNETKNPNNTNGDKSQPNDQDKNDDIIDESSEPKTSDNDQNKINNSTTQEKTKIEKQQGTGNFKLYILAFTIIGLSIVGIIIVKLKKFEIE